VSFGLNGSLTSYCRNSPVPQHETYRKRSSRLRLISVMSGGTALKGLSAGGSCAGSAGSAGTSIVLRICHPFSSRNQVQTEADRSLFETTTPTKPNSLVGSCDGLGSSTICC